MNRREPLRLSALMGCSQPIQRFVPLGLVLFPTDLSLGKSHLSCLNPVFTSHFHPQEPKGIFPNLHEPELKGQ